MELQKDFANHLPLTFLHPLNENNLADQANKIKMIMHNEKNNILLRVLNKLQDKEHLNEDVSQIVDNFIFESESRDAEYFSMLRTNLGEPSSRMEAKMLLKYLNESVNKAKEIKFPNINQFYE